MKINQSREFIVKPLVVAWVPPEAHLLTHPEQCHQNCSPLLSSHLPHSVIINALKQRAESVQLHEK